MNEPMDGRRPSFPRTLFPLGGALILLAAALAIVFLLADPDELER